MKKKVLFLGYSLTSKESAEYFVNKGYDVYISEFGEKKEDTSKIENLGVKLEFNGHTDDFIKDADFCIISPSIKDDAPVLSKIKCPLYSDLEYTGVELNYQDKMVLITGTNGKTTTTMLVSHILDVPCAGNIGTPPLSVLKDKNPKYLSIEASSYQLHYSKTLSPKIAILCNITPDHISWHNGMDGYIKDKTDILKRMKTGQSVILNYDDPYTKTFADEIKADIYYFSLKKINKENTCYIDNDTIYFNNEKIIDIKDIFLKGNHNYQNIMSAVIAAKILNYDTDLISEKIKTFKAPAHRLEYIATIGKTEYYNDSKATNPEASNVAITSFPNKKVSLIAGGRDKNTPLDEFVSLIKKNIEQVILIGEAGERFNEALIHSGFKNIKFAKTLEEAIDDASNNNPDVVLFSPACASFDMFKNFEERGECFREYVLQKQSSK